MKYEQFDKWDDWTFGGSAMVGQIKITREELVAKFGEPTYPDGERIKERWLFKAENGTVFTIFQDTKVRRFDPAYWFIGGFGHYDKKTKENLSYRTAMQVIGM